MKGDSGHRSPDCPAPGLDLVLDVTLAHDDELVPETSLWVAPVRQDWV